MLEESRRRLASEFSVGLVIHRSKRFQSEYSLPPSPFGREITYLTDPNGECAERTKAKAQGRKPREPNQEIIAARGAGDSRLCCHAGSSTPISIILDLAVARSAGLAWVNRRFLGLTPQALCFRALRALSGSIKYMNALPKGEGVKLYLY